MTPEEIALVFADATAKAMPIDGNPSDDDLTAMREVLIPILLSIPYDADGTHNLVGLIQPTATYTRIGAQPSPVPLGPGPTTRILPSMPPP